MVPCIPVLRVQGKRVFFFFLGGGGGGGGGNSSMDAFSLYHVCVVRISDLCGSY